MPGGLDVGRIFATLGADVQAAGFRVFDDKLAQARAEARKPVVAKLLAENAGGRQISSYERQVQVARERSAKPIVQRMVVESNTAGITRHNAAVRETEAVHTKAARGANAFTQSLTGVNAKALGAVGGLVALGAVVKTGVDRFSEMQVTQAKIDAALKSTGDAAHVTKRGIDALATSIGNKSGIDHEQIKSAEAMLLMFPRISNAAGKNNDIFNQATLAATNLSAKLGKDLPTSARIVGRALNDPVKGTTLLTRVGIQLDDATKKHIKTLEDHHKHLEAQKVILDLLNKRFGGQAAAYGKTLPAALTRASTAFKDLAAKIGALVGPVMTKAANAVSKFLTSLTSKHPKGFAKDVVDAFRTVSRAVSQVAGDFDRFLTKNRKTFRDLGDIISFVFRKVMAPTFFFIRDVAQRAFKGLVDIFSGAFKIIKGSVEIFSGLLHGDFSKMWKGIKDMFSGAFQVIKGIFREVTAPIRELAGKIGSAMEGPLSSAWKTIRGIFNGGVGAVKGILQGAGHIFSDVIRGLAGGVASAFHAVFDPIVGIAKDFINSVIGILDVPLDAIGAPHINKLGSGGTVLPSDVKAGAEARSGRHGPRPPVRPSGPHDAGRSDRHPSRGHGRG